MLTDEQRLMHLTEPQFHDPGGHGLPDEPDAVEWEMFGDLGKREVHIVDHDLRPATLGHDHDDDELTWTGPPIALPPGLVEHYAQRAQEGPVPGWFQPPTPPAADAIPTEPDELGMRGIFQVNTKHEAGELDPAQWAAGLAAGTDVVAVGIADVLGSILADVLASPDPASVLVPREPAYLDNVIGIRLTIGAVDLQWSSDSAHPGPYALLDTVEPNSGKRLLVVCNHRTASAQVIQLLALGAFPVDVVAQQGTRPLPDGQLPVWLTASPPQPGY